MNTQEIVQDFRRRYENTFVQVSMEQKGVKVLGRMVQIAEDSDKLAVMQIDTKTFGRLMVNFGSEEYQIRFEQPKSGVFQFKHGAQVWCRRPERQYTRGVCASNAAIVPTTNKITGGIGAVSFSLDSVHAAFEHQTYGMSFAMKALNGGKCRSVALHNDFSVALPMTPGGYYYVFHWLNLVGAVDKEGKLVHVYEPVYEQALKELTNG